MANHDHELIIVLLVDDQKFVGAALQRLLATEPDIELHCCLTATDAVAVANQVNPTIILQDVFMPEIDGLTLIASYRGNPATAATPIIALSGNDDDDTRSRALAAGARDYLVKLPAKTDLLACIRRHAAQQPPAAGEEAVGSAAIAETDHRDVFDRAVLAAFCAPDGTGSSDFAVQLLDQFIREAESRVADLCDAAGRHDVPALIETTHSLKGSSLVMGARRMAALCAQVETTLQGAVQSVLPAPQLEAFNEELVRLRGALAAERMV